MKNISTWEMLRESFTDKTIAVVGNAESLFGKGHGWLIDTNDIVCRFNAGAIVKDPDSQGTRTDVAIMSPPHIWSDTIKQLNDTYNDTVTIVHLTSRFRGPDYIKTPSHVNKRFEKDLGSRPSSGALLVNLLTRHTNASKIRLYGFDWKNTPTYYNGNQISNGPHNYDVESTWMRKLRKEGKIEIID